jgi:acyl-CoA thioesterase
MPFDIRTEPPRGGYFDLRWVRYPGLERMQRSLLGETGAAPIHYLTGLTLTEVGVGNVTFSMPATPWMATPVGSFLAGWCIFVADAPFGCAVLTTLPAGCAVTTSQLTMNFIRPASVESERLIARTRVVSSGKAVGLSEALVEDAHGRLLAHGTSRLVVLRLPIPDDDPVPVPPPPPWDTPHPWQRPIDFEIASPELSNDMSGYELFTAIIKGEVAASPSSQIIGLRMLEAGEGSIVCSIPASPWLTSPAGVLYGGTLGLLGDSALAAAFQTALPARSSFATLDLSMHFVRPVPPDGRDLLARARIVHTGRSFAVGEAEIVNADGKLVARVTESALMRPGRPWTTSPVVVADEPQEEEA